MRLKHLFIGSVAVCALSGAGALAQSSQSDNGLYGSQANSPQVSTPAEKQETRSLNQQGLNGTTVSPAVLNGEQQPNSSQQPDNGQNPQNTLYSAPPSDNNPPQSDSPPSGGPNGGQRFMQTAQADSPYQSQPPSEAQQQYDQQRQQYDQQQEQYRDQRENYENDRGRYSAQLRAYDVARYDWEYPHAMVYHYGDEYGLQRLYLIAEPSQQLANVPIEGPAGRWVGRVRNVEIGPDGRPQRIEVALNRRVSVWVRAGNFRFDPADHLLYTDLTREDLWDRPGATVESGPM